MIVKKYVPPMVVADDGVPDDVDDGVGERGGDHGRKADECDTAPADGARCAGSGQ
jgi:hypothetical protein